MAFSLYCDINYDNLFMELIKTPIQNCHVYLHLYIDKSIIKNKKYF